MMERCYDAVDALLLMFDYVAMSMMALHALDTLRCCGYFDAVTLPRRC